MSRLTDLEEARVELKRRMAACESDQNYAVLMSRLLDVLKQIEDLAPPDIEKPKTGLSEFERRLRERESGAKGSRSAASS